mmetsp:Transcript_54201/g.150379  ORF Transcript_54201/g.150379 Transcript_54201/m.150379 type:complete len:92 (-) Transcript_54201:176-451(-)
MVLASPELQGDAAAGPWGAGGATAGARGFRRPPKRRGAAGNAGKHRSTSSLLIVVLGSSFEFECRCRVTDKTQNVHTKHKNMTATAMTTAR